MHTFWIDTKGSSEKIYMHFGLEEWYSTMVSEKAFMPTRILRDHKGFYLHQLASLQLLGIWLLGNTESEYFYERIQYKYTKDG